MKKRKSIEKSSGCCAVIMGTSAGGLKAIGFLTSVLPPEFQHILVIVQHLYPQSESTMFEHLGFGCRLKVAEARDKAPIQPGVVYVAPANYHLLVEKDETFSLSVDGKVNYSRPSIDVMFESAARVWKDRLTGIILTGANSDGAFGIGQIKRFGGRTIAQNPETAEFPVMPRAAVETGAVDAVLTLEAIGEYLVSLAEPDISGTVGSRPRIG